MAQTLTVQYHIKQYCLKGDGSGSSSALPYQLAIRFVSETQAAAKYIYLGDFDTIAHAKYAAVAFLTNGWLSTFTTGDTYWSPAAAVTTAAEVLSTVVTATLQES